MAVFSVKGGSGLKGLSHCFCGVGGFREGPLDSTHCLTRSVGGRGGNRFIGWV